MNILIPEQQRQHLGSPVLFAFRRPSKTHVFRRLPYCCCNGFQLPTNGHVMSCGLSDQAEQLRATRTTFQQLFSVLFCELSAFSPGFVHWDSLKHILCRIFFIDTTRMYTRVPRMELVPNPEEPNNKQYSQQADELPR